MIIIIDYSGPWKEQNMDNPESQLIDTCFLFNFKYTALMKQFVF